MDPNTFVQVPDGEITEPGVVIEGEGGSFRLVSHHRFRTPFWAYDCPATATTGNYGLALRLGARPVTIRHHASGRILHGVLALCRVAPDSAAVVQRSYDIRIPESYVVQTDGGRVAVVTEPSGSVKVYSDGPADLPAWILWMSQAPLR
jgi:hypothetical protein